MSTLLATLFAQDTPAAPAGDKAAGAGPLGNPLFFMVIMGLFMVTMMWLPARKQKKELAAMMAALKAGSKIVTTAGIIGTITKIKDGDDEVVIRSEDSKFKITRASIARVLGEEVAETK
ncbi:hypothetical protein BH11PLA2_BH11PLA2_27180 [soil metagenome]